MSDLEKDVARQSEEIKDLNKELMALSKSFIEMSSIFKTFMHELPKLSTKMDTLTEMFTELSKPREEDWKDRETIRQLKEAVERMEPVVTRIVVRTEHFKAWKALYIPVALAGVGILIGAINPDMIPHLKELYHAFSTPPLSIPVK